ncbi:MAG: DUF3427 domain-containing protein [Myroides sp.]|jgi:hypothetical protein|nr:DUF3427 domain-containing protein [Myroides sp.]
MRITAFYHFIIIVYSAASCSCLSCSSIEYLSSTKGVSYINQKGNGKKVALFVRETQKNEYKQTQGYVFLGYADYVKHYGSKPMSITWKLEEPIPSYMWKETLKMRVG